MWTDVCSLFLSLMILLAILLQTCSPRWKAAQQTHYSINDERENRHRSSEHHRGLLHVCCGSRKYHYSLPILCTVLMLYLPNTRWRVLRQTSSSSQEHKWHDDIGADHCCQCHLWGHCRCRQSSLPQQRGLVPSSGAQASRAQEAIAGEGCSGGGSPHQRLFEWARVCSFHFSL